MPELETALLCEYARIDGALAHVIGGGIDTVQTPTVPAVRVFGLLLRVAFTRNECGRPHKIEVIHQGADGQRLANVNATTTVVYGEDLPPGWPAIAGIAMNLPLPLPQYGEYSIEIMIDDSSAASLRLRVVANTSPAGA